MIISKINYKTKYKIREIKYIHLLTMEAFKNNHQYMDSPMTASVSIYP